MNANNGRKIHTHTQKKNRETYIFLPGAGHLFHNCRQTSVPPGALWEGQQIRLDQPAVEKTTTRLSVAERLVTSFCPSKR